MIFPRKIYHGCNSLSDFLKNGISQLSRKNVLLIVSPTIHTKKFDKRLIEVLKEISHLHIQLYNKEPDISVVDKLYEAYDSKNIHIIVAIGGGSVIDLSKALAMCLSYHSKTDSFIDNTNIFPRTISLYAIPTTAGSGSEVTNISVIREKTKKMVIVHDSLIPDVVIIDPFFLSGLPNNVRFFNMLDTTSHAYEALLSKRANIMSSIFAEKSLDIILSKYKNYLSSDERNQSLDHQFQIASIFAGFAFTGVGVHIIHALAYALAAQSPDLMHSQAVGMSLLPVLKYLSKRMDNLFPTFRNFEEITGKIVLMLEQYQNDIYKGNDKIFKREKIESDVMQNERLTKNLPFKLSKDDLEVIIENLYDEISKQN